MKFVLFLAFAARLVFAAPTTIDAATLLRNGQDAVALNSQWKDLTSTDACQKSEMACIENSIATCANGKWDLSAGQCATGQQCFALPNTRTEGISVSCTSSKNALSLIASTGADTGDASSPVPVQASTVTTTITRTVQPTPTQPTSKSPPVVTVTVTVGSGTTTLPPQTQTISPSDASKILASAIATATPSSTNVTTQTTTITPDEASQILSSMQATAPPTTTMCTMGSGTAAAQPAAATGY